MKDRYTIYLTILLVWCLIQTFVIVLGINLIDDLKETTGEYRTERNMCIQELDSLKND